jgi:hypothetical protein
VLQEAINEGLVSLGEPIMKTILWHLAARGIFIDSSDPVDIRVLYDNLEQIVGNVTDVIMNEIYANLRARNNLTVKNIRSSDEPVIARIEKLLQIDSKQGGNTK